MSKLQPERKGAIAASPSPNNTEWNPTSSSPNHVTLWLYLIISTLNTCHHHFLWECTLLRFVFCLDTVKRHSAFSVC